MKSVAWMHGGKILLTEAVKAECLQSLRTKLWCAGAKVCGLSCWRDLLMQEREFPFEDLEEKNNDASWEDEIHNT